MDLAIFQDSQEEYLPSKYPLGSILPFFTPDEDIAQRCVSIAERVVKVALSRIEKA